MTLPLHTERLVVREFTSDDVDALAAVFADADVLWWETAPYTREQTHLRYGCVGADVEIGER